MGFLIGLALIHQCSAGAFGDDSARSAWRPFFAPKVSRELLIRGLGPARRIRRKLGEGGTAVVNAIARRSVSGVDVRARKSFFDMGDALGVYYDDQNAWAAVEAVKARHGLDELHLPKILRWNRRSVDLELIEGQTLAELFERGPPTRELLAIYARYRRLMRQTISAARADGYRATIFWGSSPATLARMDVCEYMLQGNPVARIAYVMFGRPMGSSLVFQLDPENIVIEASSGRMFLIDPK